MITITIPPSTYQLFLQTTGSKKVKKLDAFVKLLQDELNNLHGMNNPMDTKYGWHSVSLDNLTQNSPMLGTKPRIRIASWAKGVLYDVKVKGNNLIGQISKIKLLSNLEYTDTHQKFKIKPVTQDILNTLQEDNMASKEEIELREIEFLANDNDTKQIMNHYFPDYYLDQEHFKATHERIEVDLKSLTAYIHWVNNESSYKDVKKRNALSQALIIKAVAEYTKLEDDDKYYWYQKPNPSAFGRTYYKGISIQSVNRELRNAILGKAHEYDLSSCAIVWKLGYVANKLKPLLLDDLEHNNLTKSEFKEIFDTIVKSKFKNTIEFIEDKKYFIKKIADEIYQNSEIPEKYRLENVKQGLLAISFGATLKEHGYYQNGEVKFTSLHDIFTNQYTRKLFFSNQFVRGFTDEQRQLGEVIAAEMLIDDPSLKDNILLQTKDGKIKNSKIVAYGFQHAETDIMNYVREYVSKHGYQVLASVHDAIFLRTTLHSDLLSSVEYELHKIFDNDRIKLSHKELKPYKSKQSIEDHIELSEHRKCIHQAEYLAKNYGSIFCEVPEEIINPPSIEDMMNNCASVELW